MPVGYIIETLTGTEPYHQFVEALVCDTPRTTENIKSIMEYAVDKYGHRVGVRDATKAEVETVSAGGKSLETTGP